MIDPLEQNHLYPDNLLAEFTDRVLAMDVDEQPVLSSKDPEMRALEEVILRLVNMVERAPDRATSDRIRNNLVIAWRESGIKVHKEYGSKRDRNVLRWLGLHLSNRQRTFALGFVLVVTALLVFVLLFSPALEAPLTATAGGRSTWIPVMIILAMAGVFAVIWYLRFRR